jgi:RNA polymerase sigma-70 factor (ECF subfamily)
LDAWVLATAPRAMAYARSLLKNVDDAEEIVQDCYCRLIARKDKYDLPTDGLKLLLTSISNACINLRTRRKPMFSLGFPGTDQSEIIDDPVDPAADSPNDRAVHRELSEAVAAGLKLLPPMQRAAVELKSMGHTQQEIAEILGTSATNAGVLIYRARTALAQYLEPYLDSEPK